VKKYKETENLSMKDRNDWHLLTNEDVLRQLSTDQYKGLAEGEVLRRRRRLGKNSVWRVKHMSAWEIAYNTVFDLATLLLVVTAAAAALFEQSTEALMITLILILGGTLRTVTFVRANRIFEETAHGMIPVASVLRDGKLRVVSAEEIVPGDVLILEAGDTVPCDGRIILGRDSIVLERGITENKSPVHKFHTVIATESQSAEVPCEYRSNMVFASSTVLAGNLRVVATSCGDDTLISRKNGGIVIDADDHIPIVDTLRRSSKSISLIMLACVMVLTSVSLFKHEDFTIADIFLVTMSMAVASMSEFLTSIGSIVLAVTVRRAAGNGTKKNKKNSAVRIRRPEDIDDINDLERIVFCGSSFFKSGRTELSAAGIGLHTADFNNKKDVKSLERLISYAVVSTGSSARGLSDGGVMNRSRADMSITSVVAAAFESRFGVRVTKTYSLIDHVGVESPSSENLDWSLIQGDGEEIIAVASGKIDSVLRTCSSVESDKKIVPLTAEMKKMIFTECANVEFAGGKIVAVAKRVSPVTKLNRISMLTQNMVFVGWAAISEEPEPSVRENISYIKKTGAEIVLFSDNPTADLYYCHRFGLFGRKTRVVHHKNLSSGGSGDIAENGLIVSFEGANGSIVPAMSYTRAMKKLAEDGKITALVGSDWQEAGAMEAADIGISVARSPLRTVAKSLIKHTSVEILPSHEHVGDEHGGLAGVVRAMKAAGQAVRNIHSAVFYMIASQTARMVLFLSTVVFDVPLLDPVFILSWGLLFDLAAILMIGFEKFDYYSPEKKRHSEKGYVRMIFRAVGMGALWGMIIVSVIPFARLIAGVMGGHVSGGILLSLMSSSAILTAYITACIVMKRSLWTLNSRANVAEIALTVLTAVLCLLMLFSGKCAALIGGEVCGEYALLILIPLLLTYLMFGFILLITHRRKNKNSFLHSAKN